jgi:sigma-B regulation protein RsbU (phosphoserine phosphatase)
MHEMSRQTEPQAMVRAYGQRIGRLIPVSRRISLSRRGLHWPNYRVTRYSEWKTEINPWTQQDQLPLLSGGLFSELIYSNRPHVIDDLQVAADDPAAGYLDGQRSLLAIPMLDGGEALNMVVSTRTESHGFDRQQLPDTFWIANLFGRATHNLVLKEQVRGALETLDRELRVVSQIQRALLPRQMPDIPGLQLAAYYRTSQRAGGDYYDFFPLAHGQWGLLIADVSGHGTPAAVVMAITHSIAHLFPADRCDPSELLSFVNETLCRRYTSEIEAFVTAFYGVYNPRDRTLAYSCAGHNPPRLWSCSQQRVSKLDRASTRPLGLFADTRFPRAEARLSTGDRLVLYTDGITEAVSSTGEQFGLDRLDEILKRSCQQDADDLIGAIVSAVADHTGDVSPADDQTLVVARAVV